MNILDVAPSPHTPNIVAGNSVTGLIIIGVSILVVIACIIVIFINNKKKKLK